MPSKSWVTLAEAVLVSPPLDETEVRRALISALEDDRIAYREAPSFLGRRWRDVQVIWETGEVVFPVPGQTLTVFTPELLLAHVRWLFTINLPAENTRESPSKRKAVSAAKLSAWYEKRVRDWPSDKPGPTEGSDWEAAKSAGFNVSREPIREIRREIAPPWLEKGPRKNAGAISKSRAH